MRIVSVRENRHMIPVFVDYFTKRWGSEMTRPVYQNSIEHTPDANFCLPQWYLLLDVDETPMGGVGLITNDFISRMDLLPWLCALHVEPEHRRKGFGSALVEHVCAEASRLGYQKIYLCTAHVGLYEKMRFAYVGEGYHPWGEKSRIYQRSLSSKAANLRRGVGG